MIDSRFKKNIFPSWLFIYKLTLGIFYPINYILLVLLKNNTYSQSVLHISYMIHVPYYMVSALRRQGIKADYLAIGTSRYWDKSDFKVTYSKLPFLRPMQEMYWFWKVAARYEVLHLHFMLSISYSGWELSLAKKMKRKVVVHFRGCDIRDRTNNMKISPEVNICQNCDYFINYTGKYNCESDYVKQRRNLVTNYADLFLFTTPDLKDFVPNNSVCLSFFTPEIDISSFFSSGNGKEIKDSIKIVHATNHPGIEDTKEIRNIIDSLKQDGYNIEFLFLNKIPHLEVLKEYQNADLSIGKMKMGYYANAQVESMFFGVPAITYVRDEFVTDDLKDSGFILTNLDDLKTTLKYFLSNPAELKKKKMIARSSILSLHNNDKLARSLVGLYRSINLSGDICAISEKN
ncbi:MAG: hypothetical protein AB1755_02530 [Candidatus Omnitrophota bacterium]